MTTTTERRGDPSRPKDKRHQDTNKPRRKKQADVKCSPGKVWVALDAHLCVRNGESVRDVFLPVNRLGMTEATKRES